MQQHRNPDELKVQIELQQHVVGYLSRPLAPMLCRSCSAMDWLVMAAGYNELFICLISSEDMKGVPLPMSIKQTDIEFTSATTIISAM